METLVSCLFSHKCSEESHSLGATLRQLLSESTIDLLIDPLRIGDDIDTRLDSFQFDTCLFLYSVDSLASKACRRELRTARRRSVPVLVVVKAIAVPTRQLMKRLYWSIPPVESPAFVTGAHELARAIRARAELHQNLKSLTSDRPPDETQLVAETLALKTDPSLVAEVVSVLVMRYLEIADPTTRFWIALALGTASTPRAARLLDTLPVPDHPYVREGVKQAQAMITSRRKLSDSQRMEKVC